MKRLGDNWLLRLLLMLWTGAFCILLTLQVVLLVKMPDFDVGVRVVKLMYDFSSPRELAENQYEVEALLAPGEWERLKLDNTIRVTNTYQKFGYSTSHVRIVDYSEGCVIYRLVNDNIDPDTLWLFAYKVDESTHRLYDVYEYRLRDVVDGRYTS